MMTDWTIIIGMKLALIERIREDDELADLILRSSFCVDDLMKIKISDFHKFMEYRGEPYKISRNWESCLLYDREQVPVPENSIKIDKSLLLKVIKAHRYFLHNFVHDGLAELAESIKEVFEVEDVFDIPPAWAELFILNRGYNYECAEQAWRDYFWDDYHYEDCEAPQWIIDLYDEQKGEH